MIHRENKEERISDEIKSKKQRAEIGDDEQSGQKVETRLDCRESLRIRGASQRGAE